jgi:ribosome-associated translation inhibitor RaiA
MKLPLDLRFIGLKPSEAVESAVHARIGHLESLCPDVTAWRVTVQQQHAPDTQGRPFAVRVEVILPRQEVAFTRVHDEDVYVALRDAFDAARRNMETLVGMRGGDVEHQAA